ncbi:hypothetical protein CI610_02759 [invertebrate metagenome]|uniref:Uncharacterized protein n=1 Tax=invertebrate metagenome TaxID=1711999 RepID=A0A2H9T512_9ZZZZ
MVEQELFITELDLYLENKDINKDILIEGYSGKAKNQKDKTIKSWLRPFKVWINNRYGNKSGSQESRKKNTSHQTRKVLLSERVIGPNILHSINDKIGKEYQWLYPDESMDFLLWSREKFLKYHAINSERAQKSATVWSTLFHGWVFRGIDQNDAIADFRKTPFDVEMITGMSPFSDQIKALSEGDKLLVTKLLCMFKLESSDERRNLRQWQIRAWKRLRYEPALKALLSPIANSVPAL